MPSKRSRSNRSGCRSNGAFQLRESAQPLKLAAQLSLNQLEQGIRLDEAIQFAARYHNVTCAAIEEELSRKGMLIPG